MTAHQAAEVISLLWGIFAILVIGFAFMCGLLAYLAGKASKR